jgi:hypothetical protein
MVGAAAAADAADTAMATSNARLKFFGFMAISSA